MKTFFFGDTLWFLCHQTTKVIVDDFLSNLLFFWILIKKWFKLEDLVTVWREPVAEISDVIYIEFNSSHKSKGEDA